MQPIFAVGDIHGQAEFLDEALALIHNDADAGAPVVFVGDLVDRGPDSRGVIQTLLEGIAEGEPWTVLKGNHDRMFAQFLRSGAVREPLLRSSLNWFSGVMGGRATLASYGVDVAEGRSFRDLYRDAVDAVPEAHRRFVEALPVRHQVADLFFAHAGVRPGVPFDAQTEDDLLWIRDAFLNDTRDFGALVVHGHTPDNYPMHCGNRINVDGGAGYGNPIVPVVIEGRKAWALTETGRVRL